MARRIPIATPVIGEREISYVTAAVRSGWVSSLGPYIEEFERLFATYIGVEHAIAVSNGTTGLHLALHALGIGAGDEVVLPALTFVATAHAVLQTGATPVFVDVDPNTWCIDPDLARKAVSAKTRAIIPVHLYGHPADMSAIQQIASEAGLVIIEDAAEAHGARVQEKAVGSLGRAGVFSFYGNKIITTGEGGMVTTDSPELATRLRLLRDHGMSLSRRYYHTELAFNYRITNLQAALGVAQMEQIDEFIAKRRQVFSWYQEELNDTAGIRMNVEHRGYYNVYWMTSVVIDDSVRLAREEVSAQLSQEGVDTRPFFVPMTELPHLKHYRAVSGVGNECPVSAFLGRRGLNLPSGTGLDRDTVAYIARCLKQVLKA